jgi:hypothetical protein
VNHYWISSASQADSAGSIPVIRSHQGFRGSATSPLSMAKRLSGHLVVMNSKARLRHGGPSLRPAVQEQINREGRSSPPRSTGSSRVCLAPTSAAARAGPEYAPLARPHRRAAADALVARSRRRCTHENRLKASQKSWTSSALGASRSHGIIAFPRIPGIDTHGRRVPPLHQSPTSTASCWYGA